MGTWNSPAQVPPVPPLPPGGEPDLAYLKVLQDYIKQMSNVLSALRNDLEFMINGNLDAKNIRANSIETKNLKAGAVTADKITVTELSAISANLGHITAGLIEAITIIGSEIKTANNGVYPNIVLSALGNLLTASLDAANFIAIDPDLTGTPTLRVKSPTVDALLSSVSSAFSILVVTGNVSINSSTGDVTLNAADQMRLSCSSLTMNGDSGFSGTFSAGVNTVHVDNGIITGVT